MGLAQGEIAACGVGGVGVVLGGPRTASGCAAASEEGSVQAQRVQGLGRFRDPNGPGIPGGDLEGVAGYGPGAAVQVDGIAGRAVIYAHIKVVDLAVCEVKGGVDAAGKLRTTGRYAARRAGVLVNAGNGKAGGQITLDPEALQDGERTQVGAHRGGSGRSRSPRSCRSCCPVARWTGHRTANPWWFHRPRSHSGSDAEIRRRHTERCRWPRFRRWRIPGAKCWRKGPAALKPLTSIPLK